MLLVISAAANHCAALRQSWTDTWTGHWYDPPSGCAELREP